MNVSNARIIRKLTARFLRVAKTRNIIAVIAIALTSVMFTSVFTIGGNMLGAIQEQTMRQVGTSAHGGLKYLTREQYENFAASPLIEDIGYNIFLAFAENEALKEINCALFYGEDKLAEWSFSKPTVGRMPRATNEIACGVSALEALGVPLELGAPVPIEFTYNDKKYAEIFTLCGYWRDDAATAGQVAWVALDYVDAVLAEHPAPQGGDIRGTIDADVWFGDSWNLESKMKRLIAERGYSGEQIYYGVNWAYAAGDIDPAVAAVVGFVLALILLSGYLIIYSIFAISVAADITFYGLLKTIGTTGRQIKRVVRGQALALSAAGIPAGLILGYACGHWLSPLVISMTNVKDVYERNASPLIFVFAAAFSLAAVFAGCRKPVKIAARVSPIEAVTYSGVSGDGKRKAKRTGKVTPFTMAAANVLRNKRKLCVITLSLSLSLIMLNATASATQSFDLDEYVSASIVSDFAVADYTVYSAASIKDFAGVTPEFLSEAEKQGAAEMSNLYYNYDPGSPEEGGGQEVYGAGEIQARRISDISYDKLRSGNYAIVCKDVFAYGDYPVAVPNVGDKIWLRKDGKNEATEFEVIALIDNYQYNSTYSRSYGNSLKIIIADERFLDFFGETQPMQTNINAENAAEFERWLGTYTNEVEPDLAYISRATLKAEFDILLRVYTALGGSLALILALMGVLNFINTIAASILSRKREFAMLQSIGMTGGQLRGTLFAEGVVYTALTAAFTLTVGLGFGLMITRLIAGRIWFFKESFTALPSIICLPILLAVCAAAPIMCNAKMNRDSVVERLRVE
jgi:putative ABC transport system permease protein